jgi:predicted nucleotidyltransferase
MIEFYGGYQVYSESGVDLTLLRENLKRTATERLQKNLRMLPLVEELRHSGRAKSPGEPQQARRRRMVEPEALLRQLADHQVEYVLIGGLAMVAHGSAHITEDLDVCYSRSPKNITALAAAFAPLHPYLRGAPPGLPFSFDVPTIAAALNFTLITDLGDVDVLGEVTGIGMYEQVFAQSEEKTLFGLKVRVLSLDGLLVSKRAAGRIKDRNHILELEELKKMRDDSFRG